MHLGSEPEGRRIHKGRRVYLALALIMLLQAAVMVGMGRCKAGYHMDEFWAYGCANSTGAAILHMDGAYLNQWHDREENYYHDYLTVQRGETFSYRAVYRNLTQDNHPPLYFFLLHTVCSFFPDRFSHWMGTAPNILFSLLTVLVLFLMGRRLLRDDALALLPAALWGLTASAMSMVVFARMYALFTLLAALLLYLHILLLEAMRGGGRRKWLLPGMAVVTFLGIMTHYYFLIFCFFTCGTVFLWLLIRKKWRALGLYCVAEFGALFASLLFFPAMLRRLFFGDRGIQAVASLSDLSHWGAYFREDLSVLSHKLFHGCLPALALGLALGAAFLLLRRLRRPVGPGRVSLRPETAAALWLLAVALGYVAVIAQIAPYRDIRYLACVTPSLLLCFVMAALGVLGRLLRPRWVGVAALCAIMAVLTVLSYPGDIEPLYMDEGERIAAAESCRDYPAVVVSGNDRWRAARETCEIALHSSVYNVRSDDLDEAGRERIAARIGDGFVLYLIGDLELPDTLTDLGLSKRVGTRRLYTSSCAAVYFVIPRQSR